MNIGLRLTSDWQETSHWRDLIVNHHFSIKTLLEEGISYIEFGLWHRKQTHFATPEEEMTILAQQAIHLITEGFKIHIHPYIHYDHPGESYVKAYDEERKETASDGFIQMIALGADIGKRQGSPVTLVFHPASQKLSSTDCLEPDRLRSELISRSNLFFKQAQNYIRHWRLPVEVVSEIQPPADPNMIAIGDKPNELLATVQDTDWGICWDMGHYLLSSQRYGFNPYPEKEFLNRVRHVHLHGVINGQDHQPASPQNNYLRRCMALLRNIRYSGNITLEYDYAKDNSTDVISVIREGVKTVLLD